MFLDRLAVDPARPWSRIAVLAVAMLCACDGAPSGPAATPIAALDCKHAARADAPSAMRGACPEPAGAPARAQPPDPRPAGDVAPPIVLNASHSAHAGDVVSLQGAHFGQRPRVHLDGAPGKPLEIVNRVGSHWLAVRIPAASRGALTVRVRSDGGTSAPVFLNAARPHHLDALQLVAGGAFRIFGRSLKVAGSAPIVTVDGRPARVDLARSDEYMITAVAPRKLSPTAAAVVAVDNGNGSGAAVLDRTIEVVAGGAVDVLSLGVGWASAFQAITATTIDAARDPRLRERVVCDGVHDDSPAIRGAIALAVGDGGGVVRIPAGRCRLVGAIDLASRVILQGSGKQRTELIYQANYPVRGSGLDLTGLADLTLTNAGSAVEGPMLKNNTRLIVRGVRFQLNTSRQMYLSGNRHIVVADCDFVQTGGVDEQGPYTLDDSAGLVFEGNTTRWIVGASSFGRIHDSYLHRNRFVRDAAGQNLPGTVHSATIDFAHRVAVVGNVFDVANGSITNRARNDGEALLTEGGGATRTENLGTVATATSTTLSDPSNTFRLDPFGTGSVPENYGVAIVGGKGAGQMRRVMSGSPSTLTVDRAWDIVPDASSRYATFVFGLEKSLIRDNLFLRNPRGIWLYQTAMREVDVVGNRMAEGGGIFLRTFQNLSMKSFIPQYGVKIWKNKVVNTTGTWLSYIGAVFVNTDARAFGIAMIGIEVLSNEVTANRPNATSRLEDYAGQEGYLTLMRVEDHSQYEEPVLAPVLGTIHRGNVCTNCEVAVRIGTGAAGTTILQTTLIRSAVLSTDATTTSSSSRSSETVIR